ncbi:MAG: PEGA domain-containing protein [Patescibacteria group bacterium]
MLSKFWRTVLFFTFAGVFLITAPLVVLHTAGYRYNIQNGKVLQTGILNIRSVPKGASVFIDGDLQNERTPSVIDNIGPGTHVVEVKKDGYSSWRKTLDVQSRQTTFIPSIVLFLTEPGFPRAQDIFSTQPILHPATGHLAYLKENNDQMEIWVHLSSVGDSQKIGSFPIKKNVSPTLSWSPNGQYLLVTEEKTGRALRIFDIQTGGQRLLPESSIFSFDVRDSQRGYLFDPLSATGVSLMEFNLADGSQKTLPFHSDTTLSVGTDYYTVENNAENKSEVTIISRINPQGIATILAYLPVASYQFVTAPAPYLLLQDKTHNRLVLLDTKDTTQPILLQTNAKLWDWSSSASLLFSDGFDIERYNPITHEHETITRFSQPIWALRWYPLGDELVYGTQDELSALELDRRGERNKTVLEKGLVAENIWFENEGNWVVTLGTKENGWQLMRRQLQK